MQEISVTYATISVTSLVVGTMAVLKKLMTTELNRSFNCGYRLNACCGAELINFASVRKWSSTHNLGKELPENSDKFVVDKLATFNAGFFNAFDLLLHNDLKRRGTNKERRCRSLKK
jgi:hypothetical protein